MNLHFAPFSLVSFYKPSFCCHSAVHFEPSPRANGLSTGVRIPLLLSGMACAIALVLIFVLGPQVSAQDLPGPASDHTYPGVPNPRPYLAPAATFKENSPRVFDRKFFILTGIAAGATVLDITTTSRCLSSYTVCQEANPILGSHPTEAKLYGVSFSILAGQTLASAWLRHKMPRSKVWIIPPIAAAVAHGTAAVLNIRTMHKLDTAP
jgi:hypothetical protein